MKLHSNFINILLTKITEEQNEVVIVIAIFSGRNFCGNCNWIICPICAV